VSDAFVKQVVFAVIPATDPSAVAERFRGYGGTILTSSLPKDTAWPTRVPAAISSAARARRRRT
jgi:hypothetical protein